jgi:hypothetical protein
MDSFDEIFDHLRGAHDTPLTDTIPFFITAALLTLATELAGVREQLGWFAEDVEILQFIDEDDSEELRRGMSRGGIGVGWRRISVTCTIRSA